MSEVLLEMRFNWLGVYLCASILFVIALVFFLLYGKKRQTFDGKKKALWIVSGLVALVALILHVTMVFSAVKDYRQAVAAYKAGNYKVTAGKAGPTTPKETKPAKPETPAPAATDPPAETKPPVEAEPVPTIPLHDVPYTTGLSASTLIYTKPDRSSKQVQSVGVDGIYTIVEEAYDSVGNIWGKLKSGAGWVMLHEVNPSGVRTCAQCGKSEPDTFFAEAWRPGEICSMCSYDNFHGGEEAKVYCKQCGTDCTYRGFASDGLCDDCYDGT